MKYKPDLNERVTIRISPALRSETLKLCEKNDLDEALVVRLALEAGLQIAKEKGFVAMMEKRDQGLSARSVAKTPPKKSGPVKHIITRGEGVGWVLKTAKGREIAKGPLYSMKAKARKLGDSFRIED